MSKYSFSDSIRDRATLPLNFEPVPVDLRVDKDTMDREFDVLTEGLSDAERGELSRRVNMKAIMYNDARIHKVCAHIAKHFTEKVRPNGYKAQVVVYDRPCCIKYKAELDKLADRVVYTGPVDAYFGYKLGALQYRSVRFETETLDTDNYQGNAVVNYTDAETPYTRIIEHKHFEFGTQPKTVISREYSAEWKPGDEPYYPVNDEKNGALYAEYKKLADAEPGVIFGGRLGEYKYYDMDKVIEVALDVVGRELA